MWHVKRKADDVFSFDWDILRLNICLRVNGLHRATLSPLNAIEQDKKKIHRRNSGYNIFKMITN